MPWLSNLSIKYKFLFPPLVIVIGFLAYLLFNISVINNNNERLSQLLETNYPVLEQANANIVIIDKITTIFNTAVSSGEADMIDDAIQLFSNFQNNISQLNRLNQAHTTDIQQIKSLADDYINSVKSLSIGMIEGTLGQANIQSSVAAMKHSLDALKTQLTNFKNESYSSFTKTITESNKESQRTFKIGIVIVVASLLFMALTAFTVISMTGRNIKAVLESLKDIAEGKGDLTRRIEQQPKDEIGELVFWFNSFMSKLQTTMGNVISVIPSLTNVSVEMAQVTSLTKDRTYKQSESASQVATSIQNMISAGSEVERTATVISQLEQDTENVDSILEVIKGVAEQTNLLALNAAIEAARAG